MNPENQLIVYSLLTRDGQRLVGRHEDTGIENHTRYWYRIRRADANAAPSEPFGATTRDHVRTGLETSP